MAQPTYNYKVTTPFANNGTKDEIPNSTEDGSVSMEDGYGILYETPIDEGGKPISRGEWNYLINFLYNAVKELQDIITSGNFTVSSAQTLANILPIAKGGTGATTINQAKINLGLGNVDNTSDLNKPISTATQEALDGKQPIGNYTTNQELQEALNNKQPVGDYATTQELQNGLDSKQPAGDYATNEALQNGLNQKVNKNGDTMTGRLTLQEGQNQMYIDTDDENRCVLRFLPNSESRAFLFATPTAAALSIYNEPSVREYRAYVQVALSEDNKESIEIGTMHNGTITFRGTCDGSAEFFKSLANKIRNYI